MRAYVKAPAGLSRAMYRTADALERYAPAGVQVVHDRHGADLEVLHIIGYEDLRAEIARCAAAGHRYAVMQYCLVTAGGPGGIAPWLEMWKGSAGVWSYYDLAGALRHEGALGDCCTGADWFYYAPLGVDSDVFSRVPAVEEYLVATSGYVPEQEGVLAAMDAARRVEGRVFHLGPPQSAYGDHVHDLLGISDPHLARMYSASRFVSGLRRIEGFELPAAEGLLCGARPVVFDRPHYRAWYEPFAEFVPEVDDLKLTDHLVELFQSPPRPVTPEEITEARTRFNWETLTTKFWDGVVEATA